MNESMMPQQISSDRPVKLFWGAVLQGRLHRWWAALTRRCDCLTDLDQLLEKSPIQSSHYAGLKSVNINNIHGTQGKGEDFDGEFYPITERTRSRWLAIVLEKLRGHELPPVELIEVENVYYVRDGHHRISVSRTLGQEFIDAEVTVVMLSKPLNLL